ncbi:amidohydrolase [Pirellulaceae bacterium SH501]
MESEFANRQIDWMHQIDQCLSHVWMVRAFLKHSDEAAEDDELADVHRELYDYMLALGPSLDRGDAGKYLRIAQKKFSKLRKSMEWFVEFQPEISGHMNFRMAAKSLQLAVGEIERLLASVAEQTANSSTAPSGFPASTGSIGPTGFVGPTESLPDEDESEDAEENSTNLGFGDR